MDNMAHSHTHTLHHIVGANDCGHVSTNGPTYKQWKQHDESLIQVHEPHCRVLYILCLFSANGRVHTVARSNI